MLGLTFATQPSSNKSTIGIFAQVCIWMDVFIFNFENRSVEAMSMCAQICVSYGCEELMAHVCLWMW